MSLIQDNKHVYFSVWDLRLQWSRVRMGGEEGAQSSICHAESCLPILTGETRNYPFGERWG